jgi:hypothetical protein
MTDARSWAPPASLLAALLAALVALLAFTRPMLGGDVLEYTVTTVAVANHGRPDIRLADIDRTVALEPALTGAFDQLRHDIEHGTPDVYPAFVRGRHGRVYPIHFFGYPMLAAGPFKLLDAAGLPPFKAFQVVNGIAVLILALALRRFFGSSLKALFGLALFMGCGGALYINLTSPECLSAAGLLAGVLLFLSGAPVAGGLLGGLAATQNPTIIVFLGFAPLLKLCRAWRPDAGLGANLRAAFTRADLLGLVAGVAVFAVPLLFNLYHYGTPNFIAKRFSDPGLVGIPRLVSFYFDLNQGMILAIPGIAIALALWGWRRGQDGVLLAVCLLFSLVLAVPTLAVLNWNSGAIGIMRYAFWGAMPILLALLLRLRERARWPAALVLGLAAVQAAAMVHCFSYGYVEFSPLARAVLAQAPGWYHPEPEIFAERMAHNDDYIQPEKIYTYRPAGLPAKTLFHPANPRLDALLCGADGKLAPGQRGASAAYGWRYIDGNIKCVH